MGKQWKQCQTLFFGGSKITDGDCLIPGISGVGGSIAGLEAGRAQDLPGGHPDT